MAAHVVVIGAGVTGLSAATRLQAAGHRVTVLARDLPSPFEAILASGGARSQINYTSPWGGAHNRWVPPPPRPQGTGNGSGPTAAERDHGFALETFAHMDALCKAHPEAGVHFVPGIEYLEAPESGGSGGGSGVHLTPARAAELGIQGFGLLAADELPAGVRWGCRYRTWCVNPMVYLAFLLRRLVLRGAKVSRREVRDPREVFALGLAGELGPARVDVVVNCSGNGFGDPAVFITKGQTCLVSNLCDATITRQNADGSWTFCVPRGFDGGTVIGGTKEVGAWDPNPSLAVRERLLANFEATYPKILEGGQRLTPIADIVGRRPTRKGGARLEIEPSDTQDQGPVVHAYGLGGRGYELSWGVAGAVEAMVASALGRTARAKL